MQNEVQTPLFVGFHFEGEWRWVGSKSDLSEASFWAPSAPFVNSSDQAAVLVNSGGLMNVNKSANSGSICECYEVLNHD